MPTWLAALLGSGAEVDAVPVNGAWAVKCPSLCFKHLRSQNSPGWRVYLLHHWPCFEMGKLRNRMARTVSLCLRAQGKGVAEMGGSGNMIAVSQSSLIPSKCRLPLSTAVRKVQGALKTTGPLPKHPHHWLCSPGSH